MDAEYWRSKSARLLARAIAELARERDAELVGFEHRVWGDMQDETPMPLRLSIRERALLRGLAEACGGWVRWVESTPRRGLGDRWLTNVEWVPLAEWRKFYSERKQEADRV